MADEFELTPAYGKGILGSLDDYGEVTFVVVAGPDSPVRGTALFNAMMDHFGDKVRAIRGMWVPGNAGTPSVNIDKVNELRAKGVALEDAVLQTWTVTRAAKRGFANVAVEVTEPNALGPYTKIEVLIQR